MRSRSLSSLAIALALALSLAAFARGQDDEILTGKIEQVESDGRLRVNGHRFRVDDDTEVKDQLSRPAHRAELVPGLEVEISFEQTSSGAYAKRIVATMMR
jgi:hypothetical protein